MALTIELHEDMAKILTSLDKLENKFKNTFKKMTDDSKKMNTSLKEGSKNWLMMGAASMGMFWGLAQVSPVLNALMGQLTAGLGAIFDVVFISLQPIFTTFTELLFQFAGWLSEQPEIVKILVAALILIPPILIAISMAMGALTTIMNMNPYVLAIMAIVMALIILYAYWDEIVDWFKAGLDKIWGWIEPWVSPIIALFKAAWDVISAALVSVWDNIIKPVWIALKFWVDVVKDAIEYLDPVFNAIGVVFQAIWDYILKPVWDAFSGGIGLVKDAIEYLDPVFDAIGTAFQWVWDYVIKPIWDGISGGLGIIGDAISALGDVFQAVADVFQWIYDNVLKPIIDAVGGVVDAVGGIMGGAGDVLGSLNPFGDFIIRPGQPATYFSPQDTVVGVKDTAMLSGGNSSSTNITINVDQPTIRNEQDINSLTAEISRAIRLELDRMV